MPVPLYLTPKMGLIPEVSTQNYETLAKALREYVSNAMDAQAQSVWVTFAADASGISQLDIRDDGRGMTLAELQDDFLAVGGSRKFHDPATVGRIGIGFLAVVPFCETITIYTKARDAAQAVKAVIDTTTMLPATVRFEDIAKTQVGEATALTAHDTSRLVSNWGETFTAFSLANLRGDVAETFADDGAFARFREELRLILPLPWPAVGPLKRHLSRELWQMLVERAARHCVRVYLNDPYHALTRRIYGENESRENVLYCQEFKDETILPARPDVDQQVPLRITGFFICDEPTTEAKQGPKLSGIVTRVLNVAVDEDTFFGLSGREERKKRVAGELFLEGLDANKAITINRNAFTETHKPVQLLRLEMSDRLETFFSGMNRIWRARSLLNKEVKRIRGVMSGVGDALEAIGRGRPSGLGAKSSRSARALMQHPQRRYLRVEAGPGLELRLSSDVEPAGRTPYRIELEADPLKQLRGKVEISRELLDVNAQRYLIGGSEFRLRVVEATETDPPCAVDLRNRFVVLNGTHPLVSGGERAVLELLVYLSYSLEMCSSAKELAKQVVDLLVSARRAD